MCVLDLARVRADDGTERGEDGGVGLQHSVRSTKVRRRASSLAMSMRASLSTGMLMQLSEPIPTRAVGYEQTASIGYNEYNSPAAFGHE